MLNCLTEKRPGFHMLGNPKQLELLLFLDCPRFCWLMKIWNHRFPRCFGMAGTDFWAFQIFLSNTDFCDGWFSNSPILQSAHAVKMFHLLYHVCDAYQRKAGSIPHGRRLVSVIVLNGQNLQIMIEVYIYIVFINLLLLWLSWWSRTTDCISPCTKLFLCK